jgi:sec-independent protein translocase protein TatC
MAEAAQPELNATQPPDSDPGGRMSFFEHLVELRKRLIYAAVAIVVGTGLGLLLSKHFIAFIVQPMHIALKSAHLEDNLYYTSPAGYMSLFISLGLYLGIALAMPFVLYQIWLFVAPGLFNQRGGGIHCFFDVPVFVRAGFWLLRDVADHAEISDWVCE